MFIHDSISYTISFVLTQSFCFIVLFQDLNVFLQRSGEFGKDLVQSFFQKQPHSDFIFKSWRTDALEFIIKLIVGNVTLATLSFKSSLHFCFVCFICSFLFFIQKFWRALVRKESYIFKNKFVWFTTKIVFNICVNQW